jgi:dipeptidyl aminopeptidase/acylaminoacyl peptidase
MHEAVSVTELLGSDLYRMNWVLDPVMTSDASQVAYVLKHVHPDSPGDSYHFELRLLATDVEASAGELGRSLLPGFDATIRAPQWSPDNTRLAFLSNQSGSNQIWILDIASGDLARVTDRPHGVASYDWSPDGRHFVMVSAERDETDTYGEENPGYFRVIRRVGYKSDGVGYWKGNRSHVFVQSVPADLQTLRADNAERPVAHKITSGPFDHAGACWSPDGSSVAYLSTGDVDPDTTSVRNIYVTEFATPGERIEVGSTRLICTDLAASSLQYSPGGNYIAFMASDLSDERATNDGLWVVDVASQRLVNLTADIDRPAGDFISDDMNAEASATRPVWAEDESSLFTLMSDRGRTRLIRLNFPGTDAFDQGVTVSNAADEGSDPWQDTTFSATPIEMVDQRIFALNGDGGGRFVIAESSWNSIGDVFYLDTTGSRLTRRRLTSTNDWLTAERRIAEPEPIAFEGSEGRQIEGWLLKPTNGAAAPFPLVLHIHGGPHSAYSMAFNFELHHLAAQGYAVLYTNPHGSHTYGRAINTGTRLDWGGKDYNDLMAAVDHVIDRPDIDENRLGVAGGSYGGWMVNYIVTRTTRFKAAIAQRSSSNRVSTMLSSMSGYKHQRWEAPGFPWEHPDYFMKISPVFHADKVETPLLLVHSEFDHLCPLMQAEEMYTALKAQGKDVELLVFLGESHHMLRSGRPVNRIERVERVADWFDRYV